MIVIEEVCQRQLHTAIFGKGSYTGHQARGVAIGGTDIIQYVFGSFLFQLDVAALGNRNKAVFDFAGYAASCIRQQCRELIFKVIFLIGLTDEIQYGQAFFIFGQTQAAAQLL